MEFISPPEIASKIMTLLDEAEKFVIIVSPYNNFSNWHKFKKHLRNAINRNIKITYYIRNADNLNMDQFKEFNIKPVLISDLHAKVYLNEKYAIISSMNILQYSDTNSIDIAYKIEDILGYHQLSDFIHRYIDPNINKVLVQKKDEIDNIHIDTGKKMTRDQIISLGNLIEKQWPNERIKIMEEYIFTSGIINYIDLMINERITIKIALNYLLKTYEVIEKELTEKYSQKYVIKSCKEKKYGYIYIKAINEDKYLSPDENFLIMKEIVTFLCSRIKINT